MAEGKYRLALQYLKKGLDISTEKNNALNRRDLYHEISDCYEKLGNYTDALTTYKEFTTENDSIFNKDKEYVLSDLRIKYETEQKENLLKEQDIILIIKEKRLQLQYIIIVIVIVIVIAVCIFLYIFNRKRNKRYLQIVRQNLYFVEQEKMLRKALEDVNTGEEADEEKTSDNNSEKYATSALSEEKSAKLYIRINKVMMNNELYKDNSLTKEKLAELLNTNRSYLSQVINQHTGLSFTHYINRLRIEEVRRILSDPEDETPLKAIAAETGFNSLSTFYTAFQSIIGMPPSAYRTKMMKIHREKTRNESFH
jgi:AraC-like DNA-binding protein